MEMPPYYDPPYGREMELLRFDSDQVNPKFAGLLADSKATPVCVGNFLQYGRCNVLEFRAGSHVRLIQPGRHGSKQP
jgi:hypothetical protein